MVIMYRQIRPYVHDNNAVKKTLQALSLQGFSMYSVYGLQFLHGVYPALTAEDLEEKLTLLESFMRLTDAHVDLWKTLLFLLPM